MSSQTPLDVLAAQKSATPNHIQHAHSNLAPRRHPDRHQHDKNPAQRRLDEVDWAYEELLRNSDHEPNFQEPRIMNLEMSTVERSTSLSSSVSSMSSRGSSDFSTDSASRTPTTPASSFKESPTHSWPNTPFTSSPYRSDTKTPTLSYQNWRAGPDIPEELRQKPYTPSHPSRMKPPTPGISNARRPGESVYPLPLPNSNCDGPVRPGLRRPAISVIVPQPIGNGHHPNSPSEKQYVNVYGYVATQPIHSAPYDLPLPSIGLGPSGEWTYSLPLTMEELFSGVHLEFPVVRRLLSGRSRTVSLDINIPSGCRPTSRLFCRRVGHEVKPGVLQDIAFIIEEKPHPKFTRLEFRDDILIDVRIPWADTIRQYGAAAEFIGIDGQTLSLFVDYPRTKAMQGRSVIKGAGLPVRQGGKLVGRGDLVVQWQVLPEEHPKRMQFVKRFWKK